jgi:hypothetical protein
MLKITLYIGHADHTPRPIEIARMADKAGLYAVGVGEHVALGSNLMSRPWQRNTDPF